MSDTPPYSEATRAYVEEKIRMLCGDGRVPDGAEVAARVVLNGLARRGLLLPEGAETRVHWGWLNAGATEPFEYRTEDDARWGEKNGVPGRAVRRLSITTPWSAVPPEPKDGTDAG